MIAEPETKKRTVQVTREDILNGERRGVFTCPIALSIKRSVPNVERVEVWGAVHVWYVDGSMVSRFLTEEEARFISEFDSGRDVEPIEVEIPSSMEGWER